MISPRHSIKAIAVIVAAVFCVLHAARAQTTYQGPLTGNTDWTNGANWVGGVFPDATNATAVYTNTSATNSWSADTITVGNITASNTSGNVVIGSGATNNDILELATTSGTPTIFVNGGGTLFSYATVTGNQGFTKTGGGNLTFRFNTVDNTFTGNINLNAGMLTINQDGSLGNTNNDIIVNSDNVNRTNTLALSPGVNSGTVTLGSGRSIVISNGVLQVQSSSNAIAGVINGVISGSGAMTLVGTTAAATNSATAHSYTLNAANTYSGATTIGLGAKVALGTGAAISTNSLSFAGGNGTFAQLDLGGNTQTVASLTLQTTNNAARVMVITNGTLNVGSGAAFTVNGSNGTTVNMSGLTAFTFNGAAGNRSFTVQPDTSSASATNTNAVYLANTGIGSNNISASSITVGGAAGSSQGGNHQGQLHLGKLNSLSATSMTLGGFNGSGLVTFQSGITDGALVLRGSNAVGRMSSLTVGSTSSGTRDGAGTLNLSNGTVDALVTDTLVGRYGAGANTVSTSLVAMGGGTFDSTTLKLGELYLTNGPATASPTINSTFQQNGGTVKVQTLTMGDSLFVDNPTNGVTTNSGAPIYNASYNLSNGVLAVQNISAGTNNNYSASSVRKINFGGGTISNYDASTDLTIQGRDTTAAGRIEIAVASNASTKTFFAESGRKITLENSVIITGSGGITKDGAGTLILKGANTYSGGTLVSAGTLSGDTTSLQGAIINNAWTAFDQSTNGTYAGLMSGTGSLTKSGNGTVTLNGANTYTGTTTIGGGGITLGAGAAISTNTVTFTGTAGVVLNLGANSQSVGLVNNNLSNNSTTLTITNGSLTISGAADQTFGATVNGSGSDLSGLNNFTFTGATRTFQINASGANITNTVQLSKLGTNTISAANVRWGGGASNVVGQNSTVKLGQGNIINAGTEFLVGFFQGSANVSFADGITNGTMTIRGAGGGTAPAPLVRIGQANSGNQSTVGNLNLTGGSIDAIANEFDVGAHTANAGGTTATGTLTMPAGTIVAGTMSVGRKSASTGSPTVTGTVNQSGGTVTATNLYLGSSAASGADLPNLVANYNLTGGALYAQTIGGSGTNYGASTVRNLNVNGGTVRNISGGDLAINGVTNTATGRINVVLGASGGNFEADSGRGISIGTNTVVSGVGALNKAGAGTLVLASSNSYTGGTAINAGILQIGAGGGTGTLGGGNVSIASGAVLAVDRTGQLTITNLMSGGGILRKENAGTLTLTGNNTYSGGTLLNGGELLAGHVNAFGTGSVTVAGGTTLNFSNFNVSNAVVNNGGTILGTGTMSDVNADAGETTIGGANSTITQISGTATVNVNAANASVAAMSAGTLNVNASGAVVTNLTGGNIAVSNGVTVGLRTGSSSGIISGSGGVAKQSASTLTLSGTNTYSGATTVEDGKLLVNGSISNSAVTVQSGAVLGGSGVVGATTILSGATIAPGNSPGSITNIGDLTWSGGGSYDWEIFNATGTGGSDWDLIAVTDQLLFSGISSTNTFNINIYSLSGLPSTQGPLAGWNPATNFSWTVLSTTNGIIGFNAANFTLNLGNFTNSNALNGGLFSLAQEGNDLKLLFTAGNPGPEPVPEPGTWAAAALLLAAGYARLRRRRGSASGVCE